MLENFQKLDWQSFIIETLRRRKAEGLTQKTHAALANVSIPTMAAFERGDKTVSLEKAFDILRVVGMIEPERQENDQDVFVDRFLKRWQELVDETPIDCPERLPHGYCYFDYYFEGEIKSFHLNEFEGILHLSTFCTLFLSSQDEIRPIPSSKQEGIECRYIPFLGRPILPYYWQAYREGRFAFLQGYKEDQAETFPPKSIFDSVLPVRKIAEALMQARYLARRLQKKDPLRLHFRATYKGLAGRMLKLWSNPLKTVLLQEGVSKTDTVISEISIETETLQRDLSTHVYKIIAPVYEVFGVTNFSKSFIDQEVERSKEVPLVQGMGDESH